MTDALVHAPIDAPAPTATPRFAEPVVTPAAEVIAPSVPDDGEDAGLGRALVLGGFVGFIVVYLISFGLFLLVGEYNIATSGGVSVFVGLFGGVGFGAMVGASIH